MRACVCGCVLSCVHACACVRACVRAFAHACVFVLHVYIYIYVYMLETFMFDDATRGEEQRPEYGISKWNTISTLLLDAITACQCHSNVAYDIRSNSTPDTLCVQLFSSAHELANHRATEW